MGAALVVGAVAVPTFYAVALGAFVGLVLRLLRSSRSDEGDRHFLPMPASQPLVLMVVLSVLVTLIAPLLFDGLAVRTPLGSVEPLTAGVLTRSNIAQLGYLILSVSVVAYLARSRWSGPELVGTATCLATILSFWSWTHLSAGVPFPELFFDNSPSFAFIQTAPGGIPRPRGIFSEPAGLATSCLVTAAYCSSRMWHVQGLRRLGLFVVGGAAVFLGFISTSTTFLVASVALVAVAALVNAAAFVLRGGGLSQVSVVVLCAAAIASLYVLPVLANIIGEQVTDKVASSSYTERSGADNLSFQLATETFGLGTGLGSNRASSFLASLLSTVGVLGVILFAAAVVTLIRRGWAVPRVRPVVWALAALLIAKVVSGPDLSDSTGVMWMSMGILAHAALGSEASRARSAPTVASAVRPTLSPRPGSGSGSEGDRGRP